MVFGSRLLSRVRRLFRGLYFMTIAFARRSLSWHAEEFTVRLLKSEHSHDFSYVPLSAVLIDPGSGECARDTGMPRL
jgi:hypothetical protein